ncbi:hypothetical protein [Pseudomonas phage KPP25]|jgi:branched-subunit amino acid transport protein AzlD|uniref:Uncharacterized protein n=1 Tax=Pseudomonas phage KPP25 TaxID=1462608 RepID=X5HZQ2_BPKP2|nr:hypothetical protein FF13_gp13 [Pseudomonas phage KPP25]UCR75573.1 hypothetical protein PAER4900a_00011 [Pseudomonas phage YMC17/07/R4900a]BAO58485.1 hypothetical protein [Pseudomonas phage KPP25]
MLPITIISSLIWAITFARVVEFFRLPEKCREDDKTLVAGIGAMSLLAILAMVVIWSEQPARLVQSGYGLSILIGFNMLVAMFMWSLVNTFIGNKVRVCNQPHS